MSTTTFTSGLFLLVLVCSPIARAAPPSDLIERAKSAVKDILKDPSSAQFKNIQLNSVGDVCGMFNAKNSYGGYEDFEPFRYETKTNTLMNAKIALLEEEIQDAEKRASSPYPVDRIGITVGDVAGKVMKKYLMENRIQLCYRE